MIIDGARQAISQEGMTQYQVQAELGWGRSFISQIFTKQKGFRISDLLLILDALQVSPGGFFGQVFGPDERSRAFTEVKCMIEDIHDAMIVQKNDTAHYRVRALVSRLDDLEVQADALAHAAEVKGFDDVAVKISHVFSSCPPNSWEGVRRRLVFASKGAPQSPGTLVERLATFAVELEHLETDATFLLGASNAKSLNEATSAALTDLIPLISAARERIWEVMKSLVGRRSER